MSGLAEVSLYPVTSQLQATGTVVVCTLLTFFAWTTVLLRVYTRARLVRSLGWDDYLCLIATVLFTGYCVLLAIEFEIGVGKSLITTQFMATLTNILLAIEALYIATIGVFKVSLALFFLRVAVSRLLRRVILTVTGIVTLYGIGYLFFAIFQCGVPRGDTFWLKRSAHACASYSGLIGPAYTHAILMALSDLFFLSLVTPIVVPTQLDRREKINVAGLLAIGTIGFIASLVRIAYVPVLATSNLDFFYKSHPLAIWTAVEPGLGIIASSLACLRPLFRHVTAASSKGQQSNSNKDSLPPKSRTKTIGDDDFDLEKQDVVPESRFVWRAPRSPGLMRRTRGSTLFKATSTWLSSDTSSAAQESSLALPLAGAAGEAERQLQEPVKELWAKQVSVPQKQDRDKALPQRQQLAPQTPPKAALLLGVSTDPNIARFPPSASSLSSMSPWASHVDLEAKPGQQEQAPAPLLLLATPTTLARPHTTGNAAPTTPLARNASSSSNRNRGHQQKPSWSRPATSHHRSSHSASHPHHQRQFEWAGQAYGLRPFGSVTAATTTATTRSGSRRKKKKKKNHHHHHHKNNKSHDYGAGIGGPAAAVGDGGHLRPRPGSTGGLREGLSLGIFDMMQPTPLQQLNEQGRW